MAALPLGVGALRPLGGRDARERVEAVGAHPAQRGDDKVAELALHVGALAGLAGAGEVAADAQQRSQEAGGLGRQGDAGGAADEVVQGRGGRARSEEYTSELQSREKLE